MQKTIDRHVRQSLEPLVLEPLHDEWVPNHVLRLGQRQQLVLHMSRENRHLLVDPAIPSLAVAVGLGVSVGLGVAYGTGVLLTLFILSCVLVGLAQQTLP